VYRRKDLTPPRFDDPDRDRKNQQFDLVEQFFQRFTDVDGSAKGGFKPYEGVDDFKAKLEYDVKNLVTERLKKAARPPDPSPDTAPVIPPVRCFGRDADVATLVAALAAPEPAALLVLGPPGIGKTMLTRRVATDAVVVARFAARRWFVELETANDAATLRLLIRRSGRAAALAFLVEQGMVEVAGDEITVPASFWSGGQVPAT
jgi:hypothetical protein